MKFGYFCNTTNWTHKPYDKLLDETREITEYCDQNKWNSIWYTEHSVDKSENFIKSGMTLITDIESDRHLDKSKAQERENSEEVD